MSSSEAGAERSWRVLYGVHPVLEALRAGRRVERIWLLKDRAPLRTKLERALAARPGPRPPIEEVDGLRLRQAARADEHQGLAALVEPLVNASLNRTVAERGRDLLVLVCDGVQDPGNLGAIYRVADATGVDLVFLPAKGSASHQLPSVAKASAGAVEHVPTVIVSRLKGTLDELRAHGVRLVALEAGKGSAAPRTMELSRPLALIVGGEDRGVAGSILAMADDVLSLPMRGKVNSLNVAAATAAALYEVLAHERPKA